MDPPLFSDPVVLTVSQRKHSKKPRKTKKLFQFSPPATVAGEPTPNQAIPPKKKIRITISKPVLTLFKKISDLSATLSNIPSDVQVDNPVPTLDPTADLIVGPINTEFK